MGSAQRVDQSRRGAPLFAGPSGGEKLTFWMSQRRMPCPPDVHGAGAMRSGRGEPRSLVVVGGQERIEILELTSPVL